MDNEEKVKMANKLYETLQKEGIDVILDDRENLNIGAKMKDCKVLGTPYMVVLGDKTEGNQLELENIKTEEKETVTIDELIERFK
jgi:prolyl-tRNA synthetase